MKKKIISAVLTASVLISSQSVWFDTSSVSVHAEDTIKIMSLGDSITDGYWEAGGYRKYMYHALEESGITNIDMVGAKGSNLESYTDTNGVTFEYDGNYSGYSGYAIQYITGTETRQGILETMQSETYGDSYNQNMMETYQPDIVLLQIGTNDVLSAYNDGITDRLENLCDYILSYLDDDDTLYVSTIPYMDVEVVYDWFWSYGSVKYDSTLEEFTEIIKSYVDTYNASIKEMVARKQSEGVSNIKFADINSVVNYQTDLYDGVHPNEQGYEKMGNYWSDLLLTQLKGETTETSTTTTTTTTITTTEPTTTTTEESTTSETTTTEETTTTTTTTTGFVDYTTTTEPITTTEPPTPENLKGDIVKDGTVNALDLITLKKYLLGFTDGTEVDTSSYDVNEDGKINALDVSELKSVLLS